MKEEQDLTVMTTILSLNIRGLHKDTVFGKVESTSYTVSVRNPKPCYDKKWTFKILCVVYNHIHNKGGC